jgi:hypothetical protein
MRLPASGRQLRRWQATPRTASVAGGIPTQGEVWSIDIRANPVRNSVMKAIPAVLAVLFLAACNKPEAVVAPPPADAAPASIATPAPAGPAKSHAGKY